MKIIIMVFIVFGADLVLAKKSIQLEFQNELSVQKFEIQSQQEQSFILTKIKKNEPVSIKISDVLAEDLIAEADRIVQKAEIGLLERKGDKNCTTYIKVIFDNEKSKRICSQDGRASGHAFGFLNKLNQFFNP